MTGLLLRLAAPMQSWGEHGTYSERDTADFPTRSGLLGLLACSAGIKRGESLAQLTELDFTVRIDRPGTPIVDFHTAGGGYSRRRGIPTAEGGRKNTAIIKRSHYLSDAVFTVACTGPQDAVVQAAAAIQAPRWQPFLGRRSCPPEEPLFLATVDDPGRELRQVPVAPRGNRREFPVAFVHTVAPDDPNAWSQLIDDTDNFPRGDRHYRPRHIAKTTETLSAECYSTNHTYHDKLSQYIKDRRS